MIRAYFPGLTTKQLEQFSAMEGLYRTWNDRINVVSRKDIDQLYLHHVLHSLSIARLITFRPGTSVLDAGTGGGFPGMPLAIMFPESRFVLADSMAKKILVVQAIAGDLGLANVTCNRCRVEELTETFDFIISRAVTSFPVFYKWVRHLVRPGGTNSLPNGIIYLKGGDVGEEIKGFGKELTVTNIYNFFPEGFFETKKIVFLEVG